MSDFSSKEKKSSTSTNQAKNTLNRGMGSTMHTHHMSSPSMLSQSKFGVDYYSEPNLLQAQLKVGSSRDPLEKEADAAAEKVMRMGNVDSGKIQEQGGLEISRKESSEGAVNISSETNAKIESSRGSGQAMPGSERDFFEPRFETDFGDVRIHTDSKAAEAAQEINARAFTIGNDVFFNAGEYKPGTGDGRFLMAHELAHTIQQNGGNGKGAAPIQRKVKHLGIFGGGWVNIRIYGYTEQEVVKMTEAAHRRDHTLESGLDEFGLWLILSVPEYLKLDSIGVSQKEEKPRDYFTIMEGIYKGRKGSIIQRPEKERTGNNKSKSYLQTPKDDTFFKPELLTFTIRERTWHGKEEVWAGDLKFGDAKAKTITTMRAPGTKFSPMPIGTFDVELPAFKHRFGRGYNAVTQNIAETWFRIASEGVDGVKDRYLHVGNLSAGCVTVVEFSDKNWFENFYSKLIRMRMDDKHVTKIKVQLDMPIDRALEYTKRL